MFNLNNHDKVLVQYTYIESSRGRHGFEDVSREPHDFEKKLKGKGKSKRKTVV